MAHKHTCLNCDALIAEGNFDCELDQDHDFELCNDCTDERNLIEVFKGWRPTPGRKKMNSDLITSSEADIVNFCEPDAMERYGGTVISIYNMPSGDVVATAYSLRNNGCILRRGNTRQSAVNQIVRAL